MRILTRSTMASPNILAQKLLILCSFLLALIIIPGVESLPVHLNVYDTRAEISHLAPVLVARESSDDDDFPVTIPPFHMLVSFGVQKSLRTSWEDYFGKPSVEGLNKLEQTNRALWEKVITSIYRSLATPISPPWVHPDDHTKWTYGILRTWYTTIIPTKLHPQEWIKIENPHTRTKVLLDIWNAPLGRGYKLHTEAEAEHFGDWLYQHVKVGDCNEIVKELLRQVFIHALTQAHLTENPDIKPLISHVITAPNHSTQQHPFGKV
ncbi:hypothetical protein ABKN59_010334 [Abortiporus biennis]